MNSLMIYELRKPYGNEHFIPIFYAMEAADDEKSAKLLHRSKFE